MPVFVADRGRSLKNYRDGWEAARIAAGYPDALFHDARRTAVRNMKRARVRPSDARQITGHATESVYLRYGKGGKTCSIQLPCSVWTLLTELRPQLAPSGPVFGSRKKKGREVPRMCKEQMWRIVRKAARRAGIELNVSPHWLRHAHGSHALDRGAPIHLVQATLGHSSIATTGRYLHARPKESSGKFLPL